MPSIGAEKVGTCPNGIAETVEFISDEKVSELDREAIRE